MTGRKLMNTVQHVGHAAMEMADIMMNGLILCEHMTICAKEVRWESGWVREYGEKTSVIIEAGPKSWNGFSVLKGGMKEIDFLLMGKNFKKTLEACNNLNRDKSTKNVGDFYDDSGVRVKFELGDYDYKGGKKIWHYKGFDKLNFEEIKNCGANFLMEMPSKSVMRSVSLGKNDVINSIENKQQDRKDKIRNKFQLYEEKLSEVRNNVLPNLNSEARDAYMSRAKKIEKHLLEQQDKLKQISLQDEAESSLYALEVQLGMRNVNEAEVKNDEPQAIEIM